MIKLLNITKNLKMYMEINDKYDEYKFLEENHIALDMAIETMRKYQQIEQMVKQYKKFGNIDFSMQIICGVVEDGNDN